jgi:hypothetical protein
VSAGLQIESRVFPQLAVGTLRIQRIRAGDLPEQGDQAVKAEVGVVGGSEENQIGELATNDGGFQRDVVP